MEVFYGWGGDGVRGGGGEGGGLRDDTFSVRVSVFVESDLDSAVYVSVHHSVEGTESDVQKLGFLEDEACLALNMYAPLTANRDA